MFWISEKRFFINSLGWKALFRSGLSNKTLSDIDYYTRELKTHVDESKVLFIHVPKAAGTSFVEAFYGRHDWCHLSTKDYARIHGNQDYEALFKVTFLRNPYSRFTSAYKYLMTSDLPFDSVWRKGNMQNISFDRFIKALDNLDDVDMLSIDHFKRQSYFVGGQIDFVGKTEQFSKDLDKLSKKLDVNLDNIKRNSSSGQNIFLNNEQKKIIERIYKKDFELYESHI